MEIGLYLSMGEFVLDRRLLQVERFSSNLSDFEVLVVLLKPSESDARAINLKLNSSQLNQYLIKDNAYYYMDSYTSPCLDSTLRCEAGFGLMVNLTLVEPAGSISSPNTYNDKIVLISSGGDSAYSAGGFYLHQYMTYGEKYLEFGVTVRLHLYVVKVTFDSNLRFVSHIHVL
jgi:hypothetical protein